MILESALQAAHDASSHLDITTSDIERILEAAAPLLMAQAWNEGFTDSYYLARGYELDGRQDDELPAHLADDVKVWNRYIP